MFKEIPGLSGPTNKALIKKGTKLAIVNGKYDGSYRVGTVAQDYWGTTNCVIVEMSDEDYSNQPTYTLGDAVLVNNILGEIVD